MDSTDDFRIDPPDSPLSAAEPYPLVLRELAEAVEEGNVSRDMADGWLQRFAQGHGGDAYDPGREGGFAVEIGGSFSQRIASRSTFDPVGEATRVSLSDSRIGARTDVRAPAAPPPPEAHYDPAPPRGRHGVSSAQLSDSFAVGAEVRPAAAEGKAAPPAGGSPIPPTEDDPQTPRATRAAAPLQESSGGVITWSSNEPSVPDSVDRRYEFQAEIGKGGLGRVWVAWDKHMNRRVAVKEMLPSALPFPSLVGRFCLEAQITGRLEHPGVVPVYDFGVRPSGEPYYVMKWVRGKTLADWITRYHDYPVDSPERSLLRLDLVRFYTAVCDAIGYAHARGVLHRDLKPKNILVGDFGEVVIIDWGLARLRPPLPTPSQEARALPADLPGSGSGGSGGTGSGGSSGSLGGSAGAGVRSSAPKTAWILGSPVYMAPEQARGDAAAIDERSEVYTLGVILYEMLAGRPPILAAGAKAVLQKIQEGKIEKPRSVASDVPAPLESICLKALKLSPADRYASVLELAEDVLRWQAGERVLAHREGVSEKVHRWYRRNRQTVHASAAASAAFVLAGMLWSNVEAVRRADVEKRFTQQLNAAQASQETGDWLRARESLAAAIALARNEAGLRTALGGLEPRLVELQGATDWQERLVKLGKLRDEAEFLGLWSFAGAGLRAPRARIASLAREGLELLPPGAPAPALVAGRPTADVRQAEGAAAQAALAVLWINDALRSSEGIAAEPASLRAALAPIARTVQPFTAVEHPSRRLTLKSAELFERLGRNDEAARLRAAAAPLPLEAADHFAKGEEAFVRGDWTEAEEGFQGALQADPGHEWSLYFLAAVNLRTGRLKLAEGYLSSVISRRPTFFAGYLLRGLAHGWGGEVDAALADFDRALARGADRFLTAVNRGVVLLEAKRYEGALEQFESAARLDPDAVEPWTNRAELARRMEDGPALHAALDEVRRRAPQTPEAFWIEAAWHERQERWKEAAAAWEKLRRAPSAPRDLRRSGLFRQAALAASQKDAAEAARLIDQLRKDAPEDLRADWMEGMAAARRPGAEKEAAACLDRFLKRVDRDGLPGAVSPAARGWDEVAKRFHPEFPSALAGALRERAWLRLRMGETAGGLEDLGRLIALERAPQAGGKPAIDPDAVAFLQARRGWAYLLQGPKLARADFDARLSQDPNSSDALSGRAYARALDGDWQGAAADAEAALKAGPRRPELLWNAAAALVQASVRVPPGSDAAAARAARGKLETQALAWLSESVEAQKPESREAWIKRLREDVSLAPLFSRDELPEWAKAPPPLPPAVPASAPLGKPR